MEEPKEIEVKFKLSDEELVVVKEKLDKEALHIDEEMQHDVYFDTPSKTLVSQGGGLRYRAFTKIKSGEIPITERLLTVKNHPRFQDGIKVRTEVQFNIAFKENDIPLDGILMFMSILGYEETLSYLKRRSNYSSNGCIISIDRFPYSNIVGTFLEIEGPSVDIVNGVRKILGLENHEVEQRNYYQILSVLPGYVSKH